MSEMNNTTNESLKISAVPFNVEAKKEIIQGSSLDMNVTFNEGNEISNSLIIKEANNYLKGRQYNDAFEVLAGLSGAATKVDEIISDMIADAVSGNIGITKSIVNSVRLSIANANLVLMIALEKVRIKQIKDAARILEEILKS